jgi:putative transposase
LSIITEFSRQLVRLRSVLPILRDAIQRQTKPRNPAVSLITDLPRSRSELILENALLRQQLMILRRQIKRPHLNNRDRLILILLVRLTRFWKQTLLIVQPDTLLRWHREMFRLFWWFKSHSQSRKPRVSSETIYLIQQMAHDNRLWGAERIRGELLKLGIHLTKRTILKYMRTIRKSPLSNQNWLTFIRNHANTVWACDLLQTYDLFFRAIFIFVIIEVESRRIVHVGVTHHPTDFWLAQQLREATPFSQTPRYLIHDRASNYGETFAHVASSSGMKLLKTPYRAPKANAICERFMGSLRRECLDHILILSPTHLHRIVIDYVAYFNRARPHQGIGQRLPEPEAVPFIETASSNRIIAHPILAGLHHDYHRAA